MQGGAKLGDRVAGIDAKTSQLITQVTALTEAIKTLAENKGTDPDTTAKIAQDAMKTKPDNPKTTIKEQ